MKDLQNKVLEVKSALKLTNSELSILLGKSKYYVSDILRSTTVLSTQKQLKLSLDLESVLIGGKVLDEDDLLAELQIMYNHRNELNDNYVDALSDIQRLKQTIRHNNEAIDIYVTRLLKRENRIHELKRWLAGSGVLHVVGLIGYWL